MTKKKQVDVFRLSADCDGAFPADERDEPPKGKERPLDVRDYRVLWLCLDAFLR